MKKIILFLILSLALVLTACGKSSDSNNDTSKKIDNKDIVQIENNYKTRGEKKDKSDAKKIKETVDVPKNPKRAIVFDYGAVDVLKAFGVRDRIILLDYLKVRKILRYLNFFQNSKMINTSILVI